MNVKGIIVAIDTTLKSKLVASNLQPMFTFGMASRYYEKDKYYPGIISEQGEITNCFLEDKFNVSWYHRNQKGTYAIIENNFGDGLDKVEETNEISLVIYTNTKKIKLSTDTLKDIFISSIPSVLSKSTCESLDLFSCRIELQSHELDSNLVFKEESNSDNVRVGVEHGLVLIRYQIKSTYRRGCTVICECN
jgi:hypothetical protein